jgi:hypothetical protein
MNIQDPQADSPSFFLRSRGSVHEKGYQRCSPGEDSGMLAHATLQQENAVMDETLVG